MKKITNIWKTTCSLIFCTILCPISVYAADSLRSVYDIEIPTGEVRTRFNIIEPERTPLIDFPLKEINERIFSSVRIREDGFIPRLLIVEEYNDNILFEAENKLSDIFTVISPGFNYLKRTNRSQLELDYSFESTLYPDQSEFTQAFESHNLLFSSSHRVDNNNLISFTNSFYSFLDRTNQIIPSGSKRSRIYENYLDVFISHKLSDTLKLLSGYNLTLNTFDDRSISNTIRHDGKLSVSAQLSKRDVTDLQYVFRYVKFDDQSDTIGSQNSPSGIIHLLSLKNTHDFSETLSLVTKMGVAQVTHPFSKFEFIANLLLSLSIKDTTFEIGYDRDVSSIGGFDTLLQSDTLFGSLNTALMNKVYGKASINLSRFQQLSGAGMEVRMLEPNLALEYKFSKNIQFRLSYRYLLQHINLGDISINSNKVNFGIVLNY